MRYSRLLRISYFGFGLLLLLVVAFLAQTTNPFDRSRYKVEIPTGASVAAIQAILEDKGILRKQSGFAVAARFLRLSKGLKAGQYRFSPSEPLWVVLSRLKKGDVLPLEEVRVTFPEGSSIYKMGEILRGVSVSDPDQFQRLVKEGITAPLRQAHWGIFKYIPTESLEGYLYPDTYLFFKQAAVDDLVKVMLARFEALVVPFWQKASKDTKYNLHEILTLASIIEKEAQLDSERAIISSVYHNRLKAGLPLAADPTIKYALERPSKKVYLDQLKVDSPYNTYKRGGLPPGPICNPGLESIIAAVYPAKTNFYYFVAKPDGAHIFSRTWAEHQRARIKAAK